MQSTFGTSAACETCLKDNCCAEAQAWAANPSDNAAFNSLADCAVRPPDTSPCNADCITPICQEDGGTWGFAFYNAMDDCINAACCGATFTAVPAGDWEACIAATPAAQCCTAGAPFLAWDTCAASCEQWSPFCGAGGGGG
jgi:hypothetical protein